MTVNIRGDKGGDRGRNYWYTRANEKLRCTYLYNDLIDLNVGVDVSD